MWFVRGYGKGSIKLALRLQNSVWEKSTEISTLPHESFLPRKFPATVEPPIMDSLYEGHNTTMSLWSKREQFHCTFYSDHG